MTRVARRHIKVGGQPGSEIGPCDCDDRKENPFYEISAIVEKREKKIYEERKIQYLVRWKGPEADTWCDEDQLNRCVPLIQKYERRIGNRNWRSILKL